MAINGLVSIFRRVGAIVCLGLLHYSLAASGVDSIRSVKFVGEKDEASISLSKRLGLVPGALFSETKLDELLKQGQATRGFDRVLIYAEGVSGGVALVIDAVRSFRIKTVKFVSVDPEILDDVRSRISWDEGVGLEPRVVESVRQRLKASYEDRGFFGAVVTAKVKQIGDSGDAAVEFSVVSGEPTIVDRVVVSAGDKVEERRMGAEILLKVGEPFSRARLEASIERINKYLQMNQFSTSRVEDSSLSFSADRKTVAVAVLVRLGEMFQFRFYGNHLFDEYELRTLLTDEVLSQLNATSRIAELIESRYRASGYHFVTVKVRNTQELQEGKSVSIYRFDIDEGAKVIVDKIHFGGGLGGLTEDSLSALFTGAAAGILQRRIYWEQGVGDSIKSFKQALEEKGYLSLSISSPRTAFSSDRRGVELFFEVELGARTFVKSLTLVGNNFFSDSQVKEILGFEVGDVLNRKMLKLRKAELLARYHAEGFVDARFDSDLEKSDGLSLSRDLKQVDIRLVIEEGTRFYVGSIEIEGNDRTDVSVILREMKVASGDVLNPELIAKSEEGVSTLGLFSKVEIVTSESKVENNRKTLKVIVRESRPGIGEVGLGGFYEDPRFRIRTFLGVTYRNMFGLNQTGSSRLELGIPFSRLKTFVPFLEYSGSLGYRSPYPFNLPLTFVGQLVFDSFEVRTVNLETTLQSRTKIESRIEKKFNSYLTGIYRIYQLERTKQEILESGKEPDTNLIGSTGPGLILDFRDDIYNPNRGSVHSLNVELASPLLLSDQDISFVMAIARNSFYFPLVGGLGLSVYGGIGYAQTLFPGKSLPSARLVNDLSLGGRGSIRGFAVRKFSPVVDLNNPGVDVTAYYNVRGEVSIPLFNNFSGAIFVDAGQIYPNLVAERRHEGVGFGVRYKTPVGPVVVDIAQGLGESFDPIFYFTVGTL